MRMIRATAAMIVCLAGTAATAQAGFTYQTVDVPFGTETELFDVNDAGTIVGSYLGANNVRTAFARTAAGAYTTYEVPGATATRFLGINNAGQTVGFYQSPDGVQHGFRRDANGTLTTLDYPGQDTNYAYRINDAGQVSQFYFEFPDTPDGIHITSYLRQADGTTSALELASPTGDGTVLRGINNAGVQSGWYFADDGFIHGTLHDPTTGAFTTYDAPNGQDTLIDNLNDRGDLVGRTLDQITGTYDGTAFLRTADGQFATFAAAGVGDAEFQSINNAGLIVGEYADAADNAHGLVATYSAVPEPRSLGVVGAAAGLAGGRRRRRA